MGSGRKREAREERENRIVRRKKEFFAAIAVALLGAAAAVLIYGADYLDRRMNQSAIETDDYPDELANTSYKRGYLTLDGTIYDYYHNFENYLFIGTDDSGNPEGTGDDFQNGMADYLMLMSIDKTADTYTVIELNRDTMTQVNILNADGTSDFTQELQLCLAHWYGSTQAMGCENQMTAVSALLGGLPINGYYSIGMDDIQKLNHAIGGVTVTLTEDFTQMDPAMKKGETLHLTDQQAYYYLHSRINVGGGTNEERMARQHVYMSAFLEQGREQLTQAPKYYYQVLENMDKFAVTNLTGKQISRIAKALTQNESKGQVTFAGESELGETIGDGLEHAEFYVDQQSLVDVMTAVFGLKPDRAAPVMEEETERLPEEQTEEMTGEDLTEEVRTSSLDGTRKG